MIAQLLARIGEENEADMKECRECFARGDRESLASCLHRISGAAQVICATEIDELAARIELLALQAAHDEEIAAGLGLLGSKLKTLRLSISHFLGRVSESA
ncbi:TPA: Hpt domain-containing protein [Enterobacter cloacae]